MSKVIVIKRNGRYGYQFEIAKVADQRKYMSKYGFATYKEALAAGILAQKAYEKTGKVEMKQDISCVDFFESWLEAEKDNLKATTIEKYADDIRLYICPQLGGQRLRNIDNDDLRNLLLSLYDNGCSRNTLTCIRGIITKSMRFAHAHKYISVNPIIDLTIPRNRIPKVPTRSKEHVYIPKDVILKIFERFPEGSSVYMPIRLMYYCGLRPAEAFAVVWEDIDFENKKLAVSRQVQWYQDGTRTAEEKKSSNGTKACGDGYWAFIPPKYDSFRVIDLDDVMIELLKREKARQDEARKRYAEFYVEYSTQRKCMVFNGSKVSMEEQLPNRISMGAGENPVHFVAVEESGIFCNPRRMMHASRCIKEFFENFDAHSLRHTHASLLLEAGINQKYIQQRLGHKKLDVTVNVYEHVTEGIAETSLAAMNKLFS